MANRQRTSSATQRFGTFSLQRVHTARGDLSHAATGVSASLPIGPFRLFERVQWMDLGPSRQRAGMRSTGQQYQSVATYSPTPRVLLVYQSATQWFAGGAAKRWDEIQTSLQVSGSTWVYTTHAVPRLAEAERFRVRLSRTLGRASSVSIEYGQLPAFQPVEAFRADRPRRHRHGPSRVRCPHTRGRRPRHRPRP